MQAKDLHILLSVDKNMSHQQNLKQYDVSLIVLNSKDTRYNALVPFIPKVEEVLSKEDIPPGLIVID